MICTRTFSCVTTNIKVQFILENFPQTKIARVQICPTRRSQSSACFVTKNRLSLKTGVEILESVLFHCPADK